MFFSYKFELTWKRGRITRKDDEEEKVKNGCRKNEKSSMGLFSILNVCGLEFCKKNPSSFSWHKGKLGAKRSSKGRE
jgi:hypothetical protein